MPKTTSTLRSANDQAAKCVPYKKHPYYVNDYIRKVKIDELIDELRVFLQKSGRLTISTETPIYIARQNTMFRLVELATGIDLEDEFNFENTVEESNGKNRKATKVEKQQKKHKLVRHKMTAAFKKLEVFIIENRLGSFFQRSKLHNLQILKIMLNFIKDEENTSAMISNHVKAKNMGPIQAVQFINGNQCANQSINRNQIITNNHHNLMPVPTQVRAQNMVPTQVLQPVYGSQETVNNIVPPIFFQPITRSQVTINNHPNTQVMNRNMVPIQVPQLVPGTQGIIQNMVSTQVLQPVYGTQRIIYNMVPQTYLQPVTINGTQVTTNNHHNFIPIPTPPPVIQPCFGPPPFVNQFQMAPTTPLAPRIPTPLFVNMAHLLNGDGLTMPILPVFNSNQYFATGVEEENQESQEEDEYVEVIN